MKKRFLFPVLLLLCLFGGTAYASPVEQEQMETITLTDENRYNPAYYQEPEKIYPAADAGMGRAAQVTLEEYVVSALEEFQTTIDISAYNIPRAEAGDVFFQILNNHPSLFYVDGMIRYSLTSSDTVVEYYITYSDTIDNIEVQKADFDRAINQALAWTDPNMTDLEKALAVHDYLVLECEYDSENLEANTVPMVSHSAYGALVNKVAVCDGYSKAYISILEELGISSKMASSESMNHAWNLVSIDGNWYHVDATWDDPTWDSIGRARHYYFMLSDAAISDANHGHKGWVREYTAGSNTYDNAFWSEIDSAICYQQGNWYYSKYNEDYTTVTLVKKSELLGTEENTVYEEKDTWNGYMMRGMYLDLEPAKNEIYFNTRTDIRKIDAGGTVTTVYQPECPAGQLIFGFTVRGSRLCYALQEDPNLQKKQEIQIYIIEELRLPEITGVTASDVITVYDNTAKTITVTGNQPNDKVSYKLEGGSYGASQPKLINAGTYRVWYRVERENCETLEKQVQVVINQAEPEYTVPVDLNGSSGTALSQIRLPEGFSWENGTVKLKEEGEKSFYVVYMPEDSRNYKTISHIEVKVTVTCPGHTYTSKVTVQPTVTSKGLRTYTCSLCGNTYTEEIAMLEPDTPGGSGGTGGSGSNGGTGNESTGGTGGAQNPGTTSTPQKPEKVTGLKVSKATADSLKFSWKAVTGAGYRLSLYKGSKAVSTVYLQTNSYTCKNLKAATAYTVKVTSYVENKGTKLYASSETSLKAATAPGKAKLASVKKKGSGKAKITWKKTAGADGYEIFMRTGKGSYKKIKTIAKGKTTTFTKSGLKKGKSYSFRIRAYKKSAAGKTFGSYSSAKTLKMK